MTAAPEHPRTSSPEVLVLHAVRLLGQGTPEALAARFGLAQDETSELLLDFEALGWVTATRFAGTGGWSLTDRGRLRGEELLAAELGTAEPRVRDVHDRFLPLNGRFQHAVTRWQLRPMPEAPMAANDHTDHRWDDRVLEDLRGCVVRVTPLCAELAAELERFAGYDRRLKVAISRASAGEGSAIDGLRGAGRESLHTIWFELHEDLVATLGLSR